MMEWICKAWPIYEAVADSNSSVCNLYGIYFENSKCTSLHLNPNSSKFVPGAKFLTSDKVRPSPANIDETRSL